MDSCIINQLLGLLEPGSINQLLRSIDRSIDLWDGSYIDIQSMGGLTDYCWDRFWTIVQSIVGIDRSIVGTDPRPSINRGMDRSVVGTDSGPSFSRSIDRLDRAIDHKLLMYSSVHVKQNVICVSSNLCAKRCL